MAGSRRDGRDAYLAARTHNLLHSDDDGQHVARLPPAATGRSRHGETGSSSGRLPSVAPTVTDERDDERWASLTRDVCARGR
jgi:hypothetical protein